MLATLIFSAMFYKMVESRFTTDRVFETVCFQVLLDLFENLA